MKQLFALSLGLSMACSALAGEVKLSVKADGGLTGTATLVNKVLDDGSKYVRLSMELVSGGQQVTVMQESTYDKTGRPVRKIQVTNMKSAGTKQTVVVNFDTGGAQVKVDAGGRSATETVGYPVGKSVLAKPEFWFVRDNPKPGDVTTYSRFDVGRQVWVEDKTTYHGKRDITIGGRTVSAHLIEFSGTKAYVDDSGDPWRVESSGMVMERIS